MVGMKGKIMMMRMIKSVAKLSENDIGPLGSGQFINYVRVPREGAVGKISTYSYFVGGEGQTHSYVIFPKWICYIRNRAVKLFGREHISFIY